MTTRMNSLASGLFALAAWDPGLFGWRRPVRREGLLAAVYCPFSSESLLAALLRSGATPSLFCPADILAAFGIDTLWRTRPASAIQGTAS